MCARGRQDAEEMFRGARLRANEGKRGFPVPPRESLHAGLAEAV